MSSVSQLCFYLQMTSLAEGGNACIRTFWLHFCRMGGSREASPIFFCSITVTGIEKTVPAGFDHWPPQITWHFGRKEQKKGTVYEKGEETRDNKTTIESMSISGHI